MDDNKKDTEVSNKGQNVVNNLVLRLFTKDNYLLFVYKKSERIVSALYLVTNSLSDEEPLKWQLRSLGLHAVAQVLSLSSAQKDRVELLQLLVTDLIKLLSTLEVAYVSGSLSEMNFLILKKELENLLEVIEANGFSSKVLLEHKASLGPDFFTVPPTELKRDLLAQSAQLIYPTQSPEGHIKDSEHSTDNKILQQKTYKGQEKTNNVIKDKSNLDRTHHVSKVGNQSLSGSERENRIIELLKTRNNLNIKDFSSIIKGCSDKTIQRDLLKLVSQGVLKKVGDRRWSRYSLFHSAQ
ncbi:MAG: DeoR family transcriptional regulator [Patescibacteria group bacterium]